MRKGIEYYCDDCPATAHFSSYSKARKAGWAVSRDYKKCYCPNCAPEHRRGAATNAQNVPLPNGWEQIKLDIN